MKKIKKLGNNIRVYTGKKKIIELSPIAKVYKGFTDKEFVDLMALEGFYPQCQNLPNQ